MGAEAWSISFEAQGATIKAVSLEGIVVPVLPGGEEYNMERAMYGKHELAAHEADGRPGAFSAVVLDFMEPKSLLPQGTSRIARITMEVSIPAAGPINPIALRYEDGFLAKGRPVKNVVTINGTAQTPNLSTWTLAPGDCNGNGTYDAHDIASGTSKDCNGNGIPDDCDRCAQALAFQRADFNWKLGRLVAADFDGDGDVDLVGPDESGGGITFVPNRGDGSFENAKVCVSGQGFRSPVADDLDGDGDLDLAFTKSADTRIRVALNDGKGTFGTPKRLPPSEVYPFSIV